MQVILILIAQLAAFAAAQGPPIPPSINGCGQNCIRNLYQPAQNKMGCSDLKPACLCQQKNFFYGIRDCSGTGCGAPVQQSVLGWYTGQLCPGARIVNTNTPLKPEYVPARPPLRMTEDGMSIMESPEVSETV